MKQNLDFKEVILQTLLERISRIEGMCKVIWGCQMSIAKALHPDKWTDEYIAELLDKTMADCLSDIQSRIEEHTKGK